MATSSRNNHLNQEMATSSRNGHFIKKWPLHQETMFFDKVSLFDEVFLAGTFLNVSICRTC